LKSLQLDKSRVQTLREVDEPTKDDNSIVSVEIVGIGGSEYLGYVNTGIRTLQNAMGLGFSGTTDSGTRVAVYPLSGCGVCIHCQQDFVQLCDEWTLIGVQSDGGFSQKVAVPKDQLFELPEKVSWEQSVFIEPFANSINAWQRSGAINTDAIGVIGGGSLGLGVVACAISTGCTLVGVAENAQNRRNAAELLGANQLGVDLNQKYDVVFDTVGSEVTRAKAIDATKKVGNVFF